MSFLVGEEPPPPNVGVLSLAPYNRVEGAPAPRPICKGCGVSGHMENICPLPVCELADGDPCSTCTWPAEAHQ